MKKIWVLVVVIFLTGCVTVPKKIESAGRNPGDDIVIMAAVASYYSEMKKFPESRDDLQKFARRGNKYPDPAVFDSIKKMTVANDKCLLNIEDASGGMALPKDENILPARIIEIGAPLEGSGQFIVRYEADKDSPIKINGTFRLNSKEGTP